MSSITNINNNSSVVNVGRTTPVAPGRATADRSIPVVLATDQAAIPVEEQNKVQSEVALSLLGVPRSEVALGIFADVNNYDVNPSEWSFEPSNYISGHGIRHLPNEAGALVEAPLDEISILTSKRFFRYQPGRVSSATFGVKSTTAPIGSTEDKMYQYDNSQNPNIRKFGIFDNFDGYYWESRQTGQGDNFSVVRRTQSLLKGPITPMGNVTDTVRGLNPSTQILVTQNDDYRISGQAPNAEIGNSPNNYPRARRIILENKFNIIENVSANVVSSNSSFYENLATAINNNGGSGATAVNVEQRCKRDIGLWIDFVLLDLEWGGNGHTTINMTNFQNAILPDTATYEVPIYQALRSEIVNLNLVDDDRTENLVDIIIDGFQTGGSWRLPPTAAQINSIEYGDKPRFETVFDTKKLYWAYLVSTFNSDGTIANYDDGSSLPGGPYSIDEIRNKCQRDMLFIIDGIKNDILGNGNAETKFNISMYFRGNGLSIFTQTTADSDHAEPKRHEYLQALIAADLTGNDTVLLSGGAHGSFTVGDGFGFSTNTNEYMKFIELSDLVINNFMDEDSSAIVTGDRGFAGNLVVYRDGLVMTHAGVFDTSMLRFQENIPVKLVAQTDTVTLSTGTVTLGQVVRYTGTETYGGLVPETLYRVRSVIGQKGDTFTLSHLYSGSSDEYTIGSQVTWTANDLREGNEKVEEESGNTILSDNTVFFKTVCPFIFPDIYSPKVYRGATDVPYVTDNNLDPTGTNDSFPRGMMFPYKYSSSVNLDSETAIYVGYVNTANRDINLIRTEIDNVNFIPDYINWVKNNVDPRYWSVYEYRIGRSRFSHDRLDGIRSSAMKQVVYSDKATNEQGSTALPGDLYLENESLVYADSVFKYDFTKVTMLKIEFSWYGAVGALFLAYVPVENGEARWVRVHHLRASNQLKIASLGNATLPITYNVFGGGSAKSLGNDIEDNLQGYGSTSHNIVKYGASYYIDGGDRGTVRLYSYNNEDPIESIGKQWTATSSEANWNNNDLSLRVDNGLTGSNTSVDPVYFMNAKIKTNSRVDNNIRVVWVDDNRIYLSSRPNGWNTLPAQNTISLLPDRATSVFGLETKQNIVSQVSQNSVRNRVQVYPTKLSSSNLGNNPVRLRMKKSPLFQPDVTTNGNFNLSSNYEITSNSLPLPATTASSNYIQNEEFVYGWFRARLNIAESGPIVSIFGRLEKRVGQYFFVLEETVTGIIFLLSPPTGRAFLAEKRFDARGNELSGITKTTSEKEGLSSIRISDEEQVPIPNTGTDIASLYLQEGTMQFDLFTYFDYNKEYLSFPLTSQADTLYFIVDSDTSSTTSDRVSLGITWEEQ